MTVYDGVTGGFRSYTDATGNIVQVVSMAGNGFNFTEVRRTYSAGGITTIESYLYTYADPNADLPILTSLLLRAPAPTATPTWTNVSQATYTYYGSSDTSGGLNDLQTVTTQLYTNGNWQTTGTTYYRY